jgi:hypothetical protein
LPNASSSSTKSGSRTQDAGGAPGISSASVGAILGGVAGGAAALFLLVVAVVLVARRRSARRKARMAMAAAGPCFATTFGPGSASPHRPLATNGSGGSGGGSPVAFSVFNSGFNFNHTRTSGVALASSPVRLAHWSSNHPSNSDTGSHLNRLTTPGATGGVDALTASGQQIPRSASAASHTAAATNLDVYTRPVPLPLAHHAPRSHPHTASRGSHGVSASENETPPPPVAYRADAAQPEPSAPSNTHAGINMQASGRRLGALPGLGPAYARQQHTHGLGSDGNHDHQAAVTAARADRAGPSASIPIGMPLRPDESAVDVKLESAEGQFQGSRAVDDDDDDPSNN